MFLLGTIKLFGFFYHRQNIFHTFSKRMKTKKFIIFVKNNRKRLNVFDDEFYEVINRGSKPCHKNIKSLQ